MTTGKGSSKLSGELWAMVVLAVVVVLGCFYLISKNIDTNTANTILGAVVTGFLLHLHGANTSKSLMQSVQQLAGYFLPSAQVAPASSTSTTGTSTTDTAAVVSRG